MPTIRQQLTNTPNQYQGTNTRRYITLHQTGNTDPTATAAAHANLQTRGNSRTASWHYTVDDREIVQSLHDTVPAWHAGTAVGNWNSIGIEMCVNQGSNYLATLQNAAWLVRTLMTRHNIALSHVVQHHHWSRKDCPDQLRAGTMGVNWDDFLNMVQHEQEEEENMQMYPRTPDGTIWELHPVTKRPMPLSLGDWMALEQLGARSFQLQDHTVINQLIQRATQLEADQAGTSVHGVVTALVAAAVPALVSALGSTGLVAQEGLDDVSRLQVASIVEASVREVLGSLDN